LIRAGGSRKADGKEGVELYSFRALTIISKLIYMDTRYEISLSAPFSKALNRLAGKDPDIVKRILAQLRYRLPLDPYPDEQGHDDIFHSTVVKNLEIDGYYVSRLKSLLFDKYRIFYLVDEDYSLIYVLEIAPRDSTTYDRHSPHYRTIKTLYLEYFQNRGQK